MYDTPCNNIKGTSPIPSRGSKVLVDSRLEIRNISCKHAAQNAIGANVEESLRIEGRMKQIPLFDRLIVLVFDGELVDDEFVEAIHNGHLCTCDHGTVVSRHKRPGV
jgi:hypothetical protein